MDYAVAVAVQTVAPLCALGHRQRLAAAAALGPFGLFGDDLVGLRWIENLHRNGFYPLPNRPAPRRRFPLVPPALTRLPPQGHKRPAPLQPDAASWRLGSDQVPAS